MDRDGSQRLDSAYLFMLWSQPIVGCWKCKGSRSGQLVKDTNGAMKTQDQVSATGHKMTNCSTCGVPLRVDRLSRHKQRLHGNKQSAAGKVTATPNGANKQLSSPPPTPLTRCPLCKEQWAEEALGRHIHARHIKPVDPVAPQGQQTRKSPDAAKLRQPRSKVTCQSCGARVKSRKALATHLKQAHQPLGQRSSRAVAGAHSAIPEGATTCNDCGAAVSTNDLARHIEDVHGRSVCQDCGEYVQTSLLSSHVQILHRNRHFPKPLQGGRWSPR